MAQTNEPHLAPGEHIVGNSRIHSAVVVGPALALGAASLIAIVALFNGPGGLPVAAGAGVLALISALAAASLVIEQATTAFRCTNQRLLIQSGLISTRLRDMPLNKIEALRVDQGPFGRLFGFGTVVLTGSGGTRRTCKHIERPFEFYQHIQRWIAQTQPGR